MCSHNNYTHSVERVVAIQYNMGIFRQDFVKCFGLDNVLFEPDNFIIWHRVSQSGKLIN